MIERLGTCFIAMMLITGLGAVSSRADNSNVALTNKERCEAFVRRDFLDVEDAPTQLTGAKWVEASNNLPTHCQVRGYVAPNIGIEILLPAQMWNGKFIEIGCESTCGTLSTTHCSHALRKGYACIASDMGHQGGGALWGYNNLQAEIDFGFRATHVTALAGKAITKRFYNSLPTKSYFIGCSTGGRQGLVEAQRFPWDFDGIVAGAPAINLSATRLNLAWASLAIEGGRNPIFSADDLQFLHESVLAKCDFDDGIEDRVISNPGACEFDPATLICKAASTGRCLSTAQAEAARKIYMGPMTSGGRQIYTSGAMPGSELGFLNYRAVASPVQDLLRYLEFMPDPGFNWRLNDLDFDRDYKRLGMTEALSAGTDPDLRRFKANGGKLILYHGWADSVIAPLKTVDYYETVERTMGGSASTRDFFRLFMIPGMDHCFGGTGASHFDFLSYLEAWVEKGEAPDVIVGAHIDMDVYERESEQGNLDIDSFMRQPSNSTFRRPVYAYPDYAKYSGRGDPNKAQNFVPVKSR